LIGGGESIVALIVVDDGVVLVFAGSEVDVIGVEERIAVVVVAVVVVAAEEMENIFLEVPGCNNTRFWSEETS
jgi:hypothetical protein